MYYKEHAIHLAAAGLDPSTNKKKNLWHQIYDHNDPDKACTNWNLIPFELITEPW